jgi:adenylate cyclase
MPRILLVDDAEANTSSLALELQDLNPDWEIVTANSEAAARPILEAGDIDLVLTDLVMVNEQGGMQVLEDAKQRDPLIMVILFTAYEAKLDRYKAFELGAFDCIQKNVPGVIAREEINVKARAALRFRELTKREIEQMRRLTFLQRYFDPRVYSVIERDPSVLDLKRQTVTIAFWDIRGFSRLCEILKAHPTLIAGFLRDYSQSASEAIFANGGVLDKFIGDGVMGLFGALGSIDSDGKQDAENAIKAAVDFRERFTSIVERWSQEWALYTPEVIEVKLGCGIHTGVDTLVGNVGTSDRDQFTALGPHVNFAARLEGRATEGEILLSSTTEARIRGRAKVKRRERINDVKNIPGEFAVYEVDLPVASQPRQPE